MTIASEIERLQTAKSNMKSSITNQGVNVPEELKLDEYYKCINAIDGGSGEVKPFGNGRDGNCTITEDTWIEAKEWQFDTLTVCEGASLRFRGQGTPIIRAKTAINNYGIIDTRAMDYITSSTTYSYSGGEIVKVANTGNVGYIEIPIKQGGGCGHSGGNGGAAGQNGCSKGNAMGGLGDICAGGGGAGESGVCSSGQNGTNASACIGGNGGKGGTGYCCCSSSCSFVTGCDGGGGGYGYLKGGDGGNGGGGSRYGTGGNGGDSFWCGGKGGDAGNAKGYGGDGGDAMGTLECFLAGCYAYGGAGGDQPYSSSNRRACEAGKGGNVMYGCAGKGGDHKGSGEGGFGGNGGCAYCGRGGAGGNAGGSTCVGYGGDGGNVVFGVAGNGGNGTRYDNLKGGGNGGNAIRGTAGNGGYPEGDGGNVYHGTPGNGSSGYCGGSGGSALGGVYGILLVSPIINNNKILACGSKGGNGGTGCHGDGGNGGPGGCVVIRYKTSITCGEICVNGGAGGCRGCSCADYGCAGANGSYSINQITDGWIA